MYYRIILLSLLFSSIINCSSSDKTPLSNSGSNRSTEEKEPNTPSNITLKNKIDLLSKKLTPNPQPNAILEDFIAFSHSPNAASTSGLRSNTSSDVKLEHFITFTHEEGEKSQLNPSPSITKLSALAKISEAKRRLSLSVEKTRRLSISANLSSSQGHHQREKSNISPLLSEKDLLVISAAHVATENMMHKNEQPKK